MRVCASSHVRARARVCARTADCAATKLHVADANPRVQHVHAHACPGRAAALVGAIEGAAITLWCARVDAIEAPAEGRQRLRLRGPHDAVVLHVRHLRVLEDALQRRLTQLRLHDGNQREGAPDALRRAIAGAPAVRCAAIDEREQSRTVALGRGGWHGPAGARAARLWRLPHVDQHTVASVCAALSRLVAGAHCRLDCGCGVEREEGGRGGACERNEQQQCKVAANGGCSAWRRGVRETTSARPQGMRFCCRLLSTVLGATMKFPFRMQNLAPNRMFHARMQLPSRPRDDQETRSHDAWRSFVPPHRAPSISSAAPAPPPASIN